MKKKIKRASPFDLILFHRLNCQSMISQSFDIRECWKFIGLFIYNEDIHYKLNL